MGCQSIAGLPPAFNSLACVAGGIVSARNKVFAAEPTSEWRSREENGERDFASGEAAINFKVPLPILLAAPPPKLYFARAYIPPATQAINSPVPIYIPGWREEP